MIVVAFDNTHLNSAPLESYNFCTVKINSYHIHFFRFFLLMDDDR